MQKGRIGIVIICYCNHKNRIGFLNTIERSQANDYKIEIELILIEI